MWPPSFRPQIAPPVGEQVGKLVALERAFTVWLQRNAFDENPLNWFEERKNPGSGNLNPCVHHNAFIQNSIESIDETFFYRIYFNNHRLHASLHPKIYLVPKQLSWHQLLPFQCGSVLISGKNLGVLVLLSPQRFSPRKLRVSVVILIFTGSNSPSPK